MKDTNLLETHSSQNHNLEVVSQAEVAPQQFRLTFLAPGIARSAQAGQFVHVLPREESARDPLLRRAFSILKIQDDKIDILYRVTGRGTLAMSRWMPGTQTSVLGPLGKPFKPLSQNSILVGGGVGVPPLAMLASTRTTQNVIALLGVRSARDIIAAEDFDEYEVQVEVATDDGSKGHRGFVTEILQDKLAQQNLHASLDGTVVYSCGPLPMLRKVAEICRKFEVACHVSLEEAMPCGIGVCNGCVVPVNLSNVGGVNDGYARYKRICIDGPILDSSEIDWQALDTSCI